MKNKNQNQDLKNEYNFGELKFESPVNFEHKSLEEIKQLADDTFRESKIKRRLLRAGIGILTVGAATMAPLAVYQFIIPVKVSMKSTNEGIKGYEVKLQRGSKVSEIKIVEIEGYDFIGFFKDKNCTIKYTGTEELNKNSVIYTSYKLKEYTVTIPTSDKYLLTTSGIVCHGEDFTFSVYPQEGYDLTNMVVKVGEKTLTPLEGVYTISNVTSDLEVSITGIEKIKYAITLTESDNCSVNIPSYIEHDEDLMFSITPDTGYNAAHVVVKVNGVEVTPNSSGIYVVKNVKKLLNISVTGIEKNIYNVTTSGDKEHYTVNTVSSVEYGDVLRFTITPNAGYSLDDILVKVNGEVVIPVNGIYTVENVSEDINIKVISEFSVSVIGDQNYTVNVVDSINYCENLIFNITPKTGYTLDDIIVKANGEVLTSIGGYYTIENITEDVIIEVFGKYTVNTTGDVNYTVDVVNSIYYGEDLTFTITPKAGYTLNNILVKVNGQEVTGNQGSYTIENISEDITIEVLGAYQINVNGDENCNVDIVNIIHYGENLSFTITPKEGYKLDHLAVKVNNQPITSASGIYTVENVTENITIDISGVEIIVCSVYVAGNEHCIVDVVDSINYGENLTFKIYAKNDCSIENIEVNVNGILITPVGGIYTVENVKTDVSILITGGAYVHTVSVQGNENCTVHVVQKILSGQDLNFHVTPKTGYTLEEMKVTVNNVVVEADEDDYYTFKDVSEDVTIVITGVKLITYTVSVDCDENYTVNVVDKVNYGQNLTFTIEPDTGYSLDSLNVTVNGDKITAVDGVYTVTNVTRNVNIVISGAGLINYSVSVTGNENCDVDVVEFIEHGEDLTFTITPYEGYKLDNAQVTVNGDKITEVSEENGVYTYTLTNVTEDITIVVTGVEKITYTVSVTGNENCDVDVVEFIEHGEDLTFTITPNEGYKLDNVQVTVNGNKITAVNNSSYTYTITNVTEDITIVVTGVDKADRSVEIEFSNCCSSSGSTYILGPVEYGGDFTFTVTANEGYYLDDSCITFSYGDNAYSEITYTGDETERIYTITNITDEIYISITAKVLEEYDVTMTYDSNKCTISPIVTTITQGEDLTFTITPNTGYKLDNVQVTVNGDVVTALDGVYTVTNVTEDITIVVTGAELITHTVSVSAGSYNTNVDVLPNTSLSDVSALTDIVNFMDYNTNGVLYTDQACTQVADLTTTVTADTTLYSKPASLSMLTFEWNEDSFSVESATTLIMNIIVKKSAKGEVIIPKKYTDGTNDGYVTKLKDNGFDGCSDITAIVLHENITTIGAYALKSCSKLNNLTIPSSVTTIGNYAFAYSGLVALNIPSTVNSVGISIISACSNLTSLTVDSNNEKYYAQGNCLIEKSTKTILSGSVNVVIPSDVVAIGSNAFINSPMQEISIPANVKTIGQSAFYMCESLTTITFAEDSQLTTIDAEAFQYCGALANIELPSNLTTIEEAAFKNSAISAIYLSSNLEHIGSMAFVSSNLSTVTYDENTVWAKHLGSNADYPPNLMSSWQNISHSDIIECLKSGSEIKQVSVINLVIGSETETFIFDKDTNLSTALYNTTLTNYLNHNSDGVLYEDADYATKATNISGQFINKTYYARQATIDKLTFTLNVDYKVTAKDTTISGEVIIPAMYNNYNVFEIDWNAFKNCKDITSVYIGSKIINIQHYAFSGCSNLTKVLIGESVQFIGSYSFNGCKNLQELIIPDSVVTVDIKAFYGCSNLKTLHIGSSVSTIGKEAFAATSVNLQTITVSNDNSIFYVESNCLMDNNKTLIVAAKNATIPQDTLIIGDYAFYWRSGISSLNIPSGVTTIGNYAFYYCSSLTEATIPDSVTSIGQNAFLSSTNLTTINFENTIGWQKNTGTTETPVWVNVEASDLYDLVKAGTELRNVAEKVTINIGAESKTFYYESNSKLREVLALTDVANYIDYNTSGVFYTDATYTNKIDSTTVITDGTTLYAKLATLDKLTFTWNSSTSSYSVSASSTDISGEVIIPNKYKDSTNNGYVTIIGLNAFNNCTGLTEIEIPANVTIIEFCAFWNCDSLTEIEIPASVTTIGDSAFYRCTGLTEIEIPSSVTTIKDFAFYGCTGLTSIEIPSSVTTIGDCMFTACSGLTSITVAQGNQTYYSENNCLIETATKTLIAGCKTSTIPNDITIIGDNAFADCLGLTEIEIPASVITIEDFAFSNCVNLTKVIFAENCQVESFGYECFAGCGITELIVPDSVTNLGGNTFDGCNSLTTVVIGNGVDGVYAFNYCDNLKTITIGSGVKSLQITGCPKLETVNFVNTVGWQYQNGSTWVDVDASELSDLVKAGTELRCEII